MRAILLAILAGLAMMGCTQTWNVQAFTNRSVMGVGGEIHGSNGTGGSKFAPAVKGGE